MFNLLVASFLGEVNENSKVSQQTKQYFNGVFTICKMGIEEISSRIATIDKNLQLDVSLNLEQVRSVFTKKFAEISSRFVSEIKPKIEL